MSSAESAHKSLLDRLREGADEAGSSEFRLAQATVRANVAPQDLRVLEILLDGDAPSVAAREGLDIVRVYKIKQRMRDRLEDAVAEQLEREDFRERRD